MVVYEKFVNNTRFATKSKNNGCTRQAANPQHIAKNWLKRQFHASMPNEKWLTDVTEFKWYEGPVVHKVYLSAILDLYDRRIVSYIIRDRNDNPLVFDTLDAAIAANPGAHPLFHSDRGFQYTNRIFYNKLKKAQMKQCPTVEKVENSSEIIGKKLNQVIGCLKLCKWVLGQIKSITLPVN